MTTQKNYRYSIGPHEALLGQGIDDLVSANYAQGVVRHAHNTIVLVMQCS